MDFLSFIIWDPSPTMFTFPEWFALGPFDFSGREVRWYGLLFALGFLLSQQVMFYMFRKEGRPEKDVEALTIFMMIGTVIGARLGHVLFYEPEKYLPDPIKILYIWEGGLASHGGVIGNLTVLYLYVNYKIIIGLLPPKFVWKKRKRENQSFLWIVDKIVIVCALTGALIRLGNFMNSEIEGLPTGTSQGVVFARAAEEISESSPLVESAEANAYDNYKGDLEDGLAPITLTIKFIREDIDETRIKSILNQNIKSALTRYEFVQKHIKEPIGIPLKYNLKKDKGQWTAQIETFGIVRHPAQIYESVSYLVIFFVLIFIWHKKHTSLKEGWFFGAFLVSVFGLRFVYELFKENQVAFEDAIPLNMGQILSIPLVILGVFLLIRASQKD